LSIWSLLHLNGRLASARVDWTPLRRPGGWLCIFCSPQPWCFFGILWRFALKRYSSASFLEGTYFLLHGYPIASTCSPASLETVSRMADLFVERMAKSKAQEEDGSSENGQLDTGEFEKPEGWRRRRHDHRFERLAVMPTEIIQRF